MQRASTWESITILMTYCPTFHEEVRVMYGLSAHRHERERAGPSIQSHLRHATWTCGSARSFSASYCMGTRRGVLRSLITDLGWCRAQLGVAPHRVFLG